MEGRSLKTNDLMTALLAFGAVVGLGMWWKQSRGLVGLQTVTRPLASMLLPASTQSVWSNPAMTAADVDDAEFGLAMRAMQPGWTVADNDDAEMGLAMRGIF